MKPPIPPNEAERLSILEELDILDSLPEESFDRITRIASHMFGTPIALVSLVDEARQWFKSRVGLDVAETPREHAFCAHAILRPEVMVVEDAQADRRFASNPLVTGNPNIRFYAGAPLVVEEDIRLGTLCVIDQKPRALTPESKTCLTDLAALVVDELMLRKNLVVLAEAHRSLLEKNEELERFSHAVAHDVAAPLRHAAMFCDQMREDHGKELSAGALEVLSRVEQATQRGASMVRELGRLSLLERPEQLQRDSIDPEAMLKEIVADVQRLSDRPDSKVELDVQTNSVLAHETYLREILTNLVQNAFKYAGNTPHVDITVSKDGEAGYRFTVADHGPGIAEKHRERIFNPFHQLNPSSGQGSGFGLALVRKLVDAHLGRIWVEETPGGGATFCFTLGPPPKRRALTVPPRDSQLPPRDRR